jgi:hypothetical protein
MKDLPEPERAELRAGLHRMLARESQEEQTYREVRDRARQTRYEQAAALLAHRALQQALNPDQAVEMVAQVFSRTSEGYFRMADEFRAALSQRFADPDFGTQVIKRVIALGQERERLRNDLDWNASGEVV